jgi:hypothetical protein
LTRLLGIASTHPFKRDGNTVKRKKLSGWAKLLADSTPVKARQLKEQYRQRLALGRLLAKLAPVAMLVFFGVALSLVAFLPEPLHLLAAAVYVALLVAYVAIAVWLGMHEKRMVAVEQHLRDTFAADVYQKLTAGGTAAPAFSLYLRPFVSTNDLRLPSHLTDTTPVTASARTPAEQFQAKITGEDLASGGHLGTTVGTMRRQTELEGVIMAAVARHAPLVCLGSRLEHAGAGRIEVRDEDWQIAVQHLIHAAQLVVVAPSERPGTLWEIETILDSNLVDRCVFIDLPSTKRSGGNFDQDKEWLAIRSAFARRGYDLPENTEAGHFLYFGRQKSPLLGTHIGYLEPNRMAEFFAAVLKARGQLERPDQRVTLPM